MTASGEVPQEEELKGLSPVPRAAEPRRQAVGIAEERALLERERFQEEKAWGKHRRWHNNANLAIRLSAAVFTAAIIVWCLHFAQKTALQMLSFSADQFKPWAFSALVASATFLALGLFYVIAKLLHPAKNSQEESRADNDLILRAIREIARTLKKAP